MNYDNKIAKLWIEDSRSKFWNPCFKYRAVLSGDCERVPKYYSNDLETLKKACRHAQKLTTLKGMARYLKNNTSDWDYC